MDTYSELNETLVHLFNDILDMEEKILINDEYKDISNNDLHNIEAVGLGPGRTMSEIAEKRHVTAGTLTAAMNNLVKKGYVVRERSEEDRRVVYIRLTEKGEKAYQHHAHFHMQMVKAAVAKWKEEDVQALIQSLKNLEKFFDKSMM